MSKELDSVELARIEFEKHLEDDPNNEWLKRLIKGLKMAEQSLQRLETIDNAKPSQALEELGQVIEEITIGNNDLRNTLKQSVFIAIIKQALIKAQENEKVLEIIKEKNVDVFRLKILDFNTFNQLQRSCKLPELTQEEFDLLKRYFGND